MGARLGQHFLFDPRLLERIAAATGAGPDDTVLEIGSGKGTLTRRLAARAGRVIAIEADRRLAADLSDTTAGSNVAVISGDALKVPWPTADIVCGNIPYQITSPLIERALTPPRPRTVVFLIQREVADRLAAAPGSDAYGALSAGVQLVARVERLFTVRAGAFRPPPRVESAVVRLTPLTGPRTPDPETERATRVLIRFAFQRRRQQLQRTLKERYGLSAVAVSNLLSSLGLKPEVRPEVLGPREFAMLARELPPI
jgi:16S rRNA (adenine1518-N6/adenine1519-N6)-dimethyltransferase